MNSRTKRRQFQHESKPGFEVEGKQVHGNGYSVSSVVAGSVDAVIEIRQRMDSDT